MSDAHDTHDHPPHLAHHFDSPEQQFDTAKMGMWVFLATEILMFGGLFCAYAIYRGNNPAIFEFAHKALAWEWGSINTVVLLVSSFTMAWGVRAAQLGQKKLLVALLLLTLLGGGGFMVVKTIEYASKWDHKLWVGGLNIFHPKTPASEEKIEHGIHYIEKKAHPEDAAHDSHETAHHDTPPEDAHGDHGADEHHAADQHTPTVIPVAFPPMPADVSNTPTAPIGSIGTARQYTELYQPRTLEQKLGIPENPPHSYPRHGELTTLEKERTHIFFQIYFLMTGLHGLHVLIGMSLIFWIMYLASSTKGKGLTALTGFAIIAGYFLFAWWWIGPQWMLYVAIAGAGLGVIAWARMRYVARRKALAGGRFGPEYYTPVDLVGLYWHLVDLIWIFLFPLLYLIH